jgi:hypothetical protein
MRCGVVAVALAAVCAASNASCDTINFSTGQNSNGKIQHSGTDAHWIVTAWQQNGTSFTLPRNALVIATTADDWGPSWVYKPRTYPSAWIAPDTDYASDGNFTVTYTFDLTGYDLATASFGEFQWSIDDAGSVTLNGHVVAKLKVGKWHKMHAFSMPAADLVQGINSLTITANKSDYDYEGVRLNGALTISQ